MAVYYDEKGNKSHKTYRDESSYTDENGKRYINTWYKDLKSKYGEKIKKPKQKWDGEMTANDLKLEKELYGDKESYYESLAKTIGKIYSIDNPKADPYVYFNRFRMPVSDPMIGNIGYVFFTRPDMNFAQSKAQNPYTPSAGLNNNVFLASMDSTDFGQKILKCLAFDLNSYNKQTSIITGNFITILTNSTMNFETKDVVLKTNDMYENYLGYKYNLPVSYIDSITTDSISFNMFEYDDMRVTYLIKAWIEYIQAVKLGVLVPRQIYVKQRIFDYMCSIYFFLCGPDGHSIKYYCKLTGCYPLNVPSSSFSWELNGSEIRKLNVQFQYQIKEELNPEILLEFMDLSETNISSKSSLILDDQYENTWARRPVITNEGNLYFR